jgi:hypothetical protein
MVFSMVLILRRQAVMATFLIVGLIDQVFVKLFDKLIVLPIQLHRSHIAYLTLTRANPWPASLSYPASPLRTVAA